MLTEPLPHLCLLVSSFLLVQQFKISQLKELMQVHEIKFQLCMLKICCYKQLMSVR